MQVRTLLALSCAAASFAAAAGLADDTPPVAPVKPVQDSYYGTTITDPYRYMENLKDPAVQNWIKAQNDYTRSVLANIPGREKLLARIKELDQTVPRVDARKVPGDIYLISKRLPTEDVAKLYIRHGLDGEDKLLVHPEKVNIAQALKGKGKNTIQYFEPSRDGSLIAVGIAPGGSERDTEMHFFDTASGAEQGDVIPRCWFGGVNWLPDGHSFLYVKLQKLPPDAPVTDMEQKMRTYLHVLGRDSEQDPAIFGWNVTSAIKVDPRHFGFVVAPPNSEYAIGVISPGTAPNNEIYVAPASEVGKPNPTWRKVAEFSDDVQDAELHGRDLYLLSYKNALRYKVLRIDASKPDLTSAEVVVPPSRAVVTGIHPAQDALYIELLDGGIGRVLRLPYGPNPKAEEVALPFQGSAFVNTDPRVPGALISLTSWTKAFRIDGYDPASKTLTDTKLQPAGPYDNPEDLESVEVKVPAKDGVEVPLSIIYRRGLKRDGSNPTLMEGYGAYGIPIPPNFNPVRISWFERGGIFAVCHVRGGGEYGEEWHLAGKGSTKPNTWHDFIACAEYLSKNGYTSPAHLGGEGGSAGGILIGRTITERPDVLAAAIDQVGMSDVLRSETTANGVPNIPEFGSTKTADGYNALYAMSSYHHVDKGAKYPAVLLETGMNDPRVDPWQMAKMTARLQASTSSGKPVLLRVEYEGGHGGIGGTEKQAQERLADEYSFLLWQLGASDFQPNRQ